jgi:hypothetical protein
MNRYGASRGKPRLGIDKENVDDKVFPAEVYTVDFVLSLLRTIRLILK